MLYKFYYTDNLESDVCKRERNSSQKLVSVVENSEYDQEIPQTQTAEEPVASQGRATQQSRDTRKTNKAKQTALSSPSR